MKIVCCLFLLIIAYAAHTTKQQLIQAAPPAFDVPKSRLRLILAMMVSCNKKCIEAWNCDLGKNVTGVSDITYIKDVLTEGAAYVAYWKDENVIVTSFRGSQNIDNWISDFIFDKVEYDCKGCEVHEGFLGDYVRLEGHIIQGVTALRKKYPTATVLAVGHSLGGSLAQFAGLRLKVKMGIPVEVHTYGSPRIGNEAFSTFLSQKVDKHFRIVHNRDIVVHLPPETLQYHHSPYEIFFNQDMSEFKICSETGEDKTCSNQFAPEYTAKDHDFYYVALDKLKC